MFDADTTEALFDELTWLRRQNELFKKMESEYRLNELRLEALVKLNQMTEATLNELSDFVLEQGVKLTRSQIGYIAFLNEDETAIRIHAWSRSVMEECRIIDKPIDYELDSTGLWGEPVRQRKAVIVNDYGAPNSLKKGYPQGHVEVTRFLGVPVLDGGRIVALAGLGNKDSEYNESDVRQITLLMEGLWMHTKRVQMLKEKEHLQAQLLKSQKIETIGKLAAGIAHDFNNVMAIIKSVSHVARGEARGQLRHYIEQIEATAERATGLTRQLLIFSRSHQSRIDIIGVNDTIGGILKVLDRLLTGNISISAVFEPSIRSIRADKTHIEQLAMNLILNAKDAMPEGGSLTVRTSNASFGADPGKDACHAKGDYVCITVQDTGTGMDKDLVGRIFEPLFSTKGAGKGTGLGLCVVDNIVKEYKGWVTVESAPGKGSTFKVFLPSAAGVPDAVPREITEKAPQNAGKRILLVEDERWLRRSIALALEKNGYVVFEAGTGTEASGIFEKERGRFDLVFSDVILQDRNGFDLAGELRKKSPAIKVLLSSGCIDTDFQWPDMQEKGYQFLQKPYDPPVLLRTIKELLSPA